MHKTGHQRNRSFLFGLLLMFSATHLWAGDMVQHELLDGLLTLQLPGQMVKTGEDAGEGAHLIEFSDNENSASVGIILRPVLEEHEDVLQFLHDEAVSGEDSLLRDEWHGEGEARYFIVEAPEARAATSPLITLYVSQLNDQLLAVMVAAPIDEWDTWRPTARAIVDSIRVHR